MKKILSMFLGLLLLAGFSSSIVLAQDLPTIEIPINTVIREPAGTQVPLLTKEVPEQYIGYICTANAVAKNQSSVHPGNDLIVSSNGTSVTMKDVERASGVSTPASGTLQLGSAIDVTLSMGQDGVFSGGMTVELDCEEPVEPIYECTSLSAVVDSSDKFSFTFNTQTKASDDVTVTKYVYDFGIDGEAPVETDKSTIVKKYEKVGTYDVSVTVHFNVAEQNMTDVCETTVDITEKPPITPPAKVLPVTGPAAIIAGLFGASSLGYGAISLHSSRQGLRNKILGKD